MKTLARKCTFGLVAVVVLTSVSQASAQKFNFQQFGKKLANQFVNNGQQKYVAPPQHKYVAPPQKCYKVAPPQQRLIAPIGPTCRPLPRFGFTSCTVYGHGERVSWVSCNGLAARMGLEPGDMILQLNNYRLTYQGAWDDALRDAVNRHNGWVQLQVRDVRTGYIVPRSINVFGNDHAHAHSGPVTYKSRR